MNVNLKKSLLLGTAALGFMVTAGSINTQASSVKVLSNRHLSTNVTVNTTGKNAIYTKAGTLKGAKVLASVNTTKRIKNSDSGQDNVLAYRVAVTNRGSVYYKVVTFDKAYRGWIYGGKSTSSFGGGLTSYTTFENGSVASTDTDKKFYIANPGTSNDNKSTTYKAPAWTQMGKGRTVVDGSAIANDELTITKSGTRTREGDTWVYVNDATNPNYSGWILRSGLSTTKGGSDTTEVTDGVTIKYVTSAGSDVASKTVSFVPSTSNNELMNVSDAVNANLPEGYSVTNTSSATAKKGDTITVVVAQNKKTTNLNINMKESANASGKYTFGQGADLWNKLSADQQDALKKQLVAESNQVVTGTTWTSDQVQTVLAKANLGTFKITVKDSNDKDQTYTVSFTSADPVKVAKDATLADTTAYFTVTKGSSLDDILGDSTLSDILGSLGIDVSGLGGLSDILDLLNGLNLGGSGSDLSSIIDIITGGLS